MTAVERYFTEVVKPCATCGSTSPTRIDPDSVPPELRGASEEQKAEYHLKRWDELPDIWKRFVNAYGFLCPRCMFKSQSELNEMLVRERAARAIREAYELGGMPSDALHHTLTRSESKYEERNPVVWAHARNWTTIQGGRWVMGDRGTGKTYMVRCILNACLDRGIQAMEVTAIEFARCAERFDSLSKVKRIQQVPVLLIDDIDKAVWSDRSIEVLWETIDLRYRKERRTFVTSNKTAGEMRDIWKKLRPDNPSIVNSMYDRMRDFDTWELEGDSIRADVAASA